MRASRAIPLALLAGVLVRAPFWIEALKTPVDGDTAIVGLMARHLGEGTSLWGQPYGSPLDAWVAAPFVALLGTRVEALRFPVFLLGLALVSLAYGIGRALEPRIALPAALLLACPPPYLLLLSALPPPFYATTLALCGLLLWLALRLGPRLQAGEPATGGLLGFGAVAGLALWTHLMSASVVAATVLWMAWRARVASARGPWRMGLVLLPMLALSAPYWTRAVLDRQATRVVSLSGRDETMGEHLASVVPRLHETVGGLMGTHVPVVADDAEHVVAPPRAAAVLLVALEILLLVAASRGARGCPERVLLFLAAGLALLAFPFPVRSAPHNLRFLTPMALPGLVLLVVPAASRPRRAALLVLALGSLHLAGATRLLSEWRRLDRAEAPFLLPDLLPVRRALLERGVRRAYASYGPAYRLTWESGEQIVASQPWNERFRHYPLPYLDEVRFAKNVAWVLTPRIPTDLPTPRSFEEALHASGGSGKKMEVGPAVIFHDFVPPMGPAIEAWPGAGEASDLDPLTALHPAPGQAVTFTLTPPRPLDALTLVAGAGEPRLLRSMDVLVSADGSAFERVAARRRREERQDLRFVNGHPQAVIDHDLLAVPLGGRTVAAVRITPVLSADAWSLGELFLHPAEEPATRRPWDEWLEPDSSWSERRAALGRSPLPLREDWHYRVLLAARRSRD